MRKDELLRKARIPDSQKEAADRVYDCWASSSKSGRSVRTPFYDPETLESLKRMLSLVDDDVPWQEDGGCETAEYRTLCFWPDAALSPETQLQIVTLRPSRKECDWNHRDVLGSVMAVGIRRDRFGDIHVHPWGAQIVCLPEAARILSTQLDRIQRDTVSVEIGDSETLIPAEPDMDEAVIFVASPRLDAVVAAIWNMSRSDAQSLVQAERVKVNYRVVASTSAEISEGDRLSARGHGRAIVDEFLGTTRKDRTRVRIRKTRG